MMPKKTRVAIQSAAVLPIIALLSSCAFDSSVERPAVRDSAGVTIVETPAPTATWRLSEQPVLQIGVLDGDNAYQFSSVAFAGRLSSGSIVVGDRQSCEIRFFNEAGRHTSTLGRCGAGPGEFKYFSNVVLAGDSLLIYDGGNRRLSLIGPDATFIGDQRAQDHPALGIRGLGHSLIGVVADGRTIVVLPPDFNPPAPVNRFTYGRDTVAIVISARRGAVVDTIARVAAGEYLYMDAASSSVGPSGAGARAGWSRRGVTFGYYPLYALRPDRLVYATGEHAGFDVIRFMPSDSSSRTAQIVRRTDTRTVPIDQVVDRYAEWIAELVREDGGTNSSGPVSRVRAEMAAMPRNHHVPLIDEMIADSEGRVWQRDYLMPWEPEETPRTWVVYSPAGHTVARIVLPANFRVTQIQAEHIVGLAYNEADVSFVTVYRIVR